MNLKEKIRSIPDFPKKGIMFRDITTLLKDADALRFAVKQMKAHYKGQKIDIVVGPESRGFIFGAILAHEFKAGFVPVRKKGKLPAQVECHEYALEYGTDKIEVHCDAIRAGDSVLIVDDLLATGGTAGAAAKLVEKLGGKVAECAFVIDLPDLKGSQKLTARWPVFSIVEFKGE